MQVDTHYRDEQRSCTKTYITIKHCGFEKNHSKSVCHGYCSDKQMQSYCIEADQQLKRLYESLK